VVCWAGKDVSYEMLLPYSERIHPLCFQDEGRVSPKRRYNFPKLNAVPEQDPDLYVQGSKNANDAVLYTHTHTHTHTPTQKVGREGQDC